MVLLEVNTQPGMTPTSLAPEQAQYTGLSYRDLGALDRGGRVIPQVGRQGGARAPGGRGRAAPAYQPAKLKGAAAVRLDPRKATLIACGLLAVGLVGALATGGRAKALAVAASGGVESQLGNVGFRLQHVKLEGISDGAAADVYAAAALPKGAPILGVDLEALRQRVQAVGWVKDARVVRPSARHPGDLRS